MIKIGGKINNGWAIHITKTKQKYTKIALIIIGLIIV